MNTMLGLLGIPVVLVLIVLGTLTFLNSSKNSANQAFMGICYSFGAWIIANYCADAFQSQSLFWSRLAFVSVTTGAFCFAIFADNFPLPRSSDPPVWYKFGLPVLFLLLIFIELTPSFIPNIFIENGTSNVTAGSLYFLFPIYLIGQIAYSLIVLIRKMIKTHGANRVRISFVLWGVMLTAGLGIVTNLLLPSITGNNNYATAGTFSTILFASFTTYAILKHHLFDIRLYAARALAYALTLTSLFTLFLGIISILSQTAFNDAGFFSSDKGSQIFFVVLTLLSALIFQPIKRFFDHVSNRLFYRDAYDPQTLLDKLNAVLVGTIDTNEVLHQSALIIASTLKASSINFIIAGKNSPKPRLTVSHGSQIQDEVDILKQLEKSTKKIYLSEENERYGQQLGIMLKERRIALAIRLATHNQHIGYLLVGYRESGTNYARQDIQLLDIISDELAIAIQNALRFEEIKEFNLTLQQKIDEATRKLRQTNEKLRALDETKDEFISMASHQLRTPLTSVKGYISMVLEGDAGKINDNQEKLLDQAFISAQRMVYLIADLLNVSRLKTGKFVIERKPTQLADVIETELSQLTETAKGRGLELTYDKPKDFPELMLDETKIRQVIMNFADNAIYYTQASTDRGHIRIGLEDKGSSVEFTVTDDGIGVPKDAQHHLFTKFYRAGNAQHARPDGTGLGLFMAKKVIVAQGGAIIFHSQEGKGSTFGFSFPKATLKVPEHMQKHSKVAKEPAKKA